MTGTENPESDLIAKAATAHAAVAGKEMEELNHEAKALCDRIDLAEGRLSEIRARQKEIFDADQAARAALREFYTDGGSEDLDVHAAVEAMAKEIGGDQPEPEAKLDESEALADGGFASDGGDWIVGEKANDIGETLSLCAGDQAETFITAETESDDDELPAFADLSPTEQAQVVATLDDDEPFVGLGDGLGSDAQPTRRVIGSSSDVSDEMLAEARVADAREAGAGKALNLWS